MKTEEAYPQNDKQRITLKEIEELSSCLNKHYKGYGLLGLILGGTTTTLLLNKFYPKMPRYVSLSAIYGGTLVGFIIAKSVAIKKCLIDIKAQQGYGEIMQSNMYMHERRKISQNNREISSAEVPPTIQKQSIFEMETVPQMSTFDDSPITNENDNLDIPEQQSPVKSRKTTYEELRKKNREMFETNRMSQRQTREAFVPNRRPETTESNIHSSLGIGTSKTKYGDVWD